jgi:putative heme transporter
MRRRAVAVAVALAVIAGTYFFVLPQFAGYGQIWESLSELTWPELALLAAAATANLATYGLAWVVVLAGLGYRRALALSLVSTAVTYLAPGGAAVGTAFALGILRTWGFRARQTALGATLVGLWNQLFTFAAPALALGLLTLEGVDTAALWTLALLALVLFALLVGGFAGALASRATARWVGDTAATGASRLVRLARRPPPAWDGASLVRLRGEMLDVLGRRWISLTVATVLGQVTVFLVLLVSLRTLDVTGSEVSLLEAFAAWSLARVLTSIPVTPGGLGVVELGLTSALVGFGGQNADVVAAVLLYRFLTLVPVFVAGLGAGAALRRLRPQMPMVTS